MFMENNTMGTKSLIIFQALVVLETKPVPNIKILLKKKRIDF